MNASEQSLQIADAGEVLTLDYAGALAAHAGESWFGVAVGFRMLQAAGDVLSTHRLWDRDDLFVVSGHPGGGVRDAIEYVTHSISRDRYRLETDGAQSGCSRHMRFAWEIGDGVIVASLRLRDGFVPDELYDVLDRRGTPQERSDDPGRFGELKRDLAGRVWDESLSMLFNIDLLQAGLAGHA